MIKNVEIQKVFSVNDCTINPHKIYVFGDNIVMRGYGGQAVIRDCVNSFGIPTKRFPNMDYPISFFNDEFDEYEAVKYRFDILNNVVNNYNAIVFPSDGLGTGMAKMSQYSPKLFRWINNYIYETFGVQYEN